MKMIRFFLPKRKPTPINTLPTELLEKILLHLPPTTLLHAQRVSKSFHKTITTSTALQRALFFLPTKTPPAFCTCAGQDGGWAHTNTISCPTYNPLLITANEISPTRTPKVKIDLAGAKREWSCWRMGLFGWPVQGCTVMFLQDLVREKKLSLDDALRRDWGWDGRREGVRFEALVEEVERGKVVEEFIRRTTVVVLKGEVWGFGDVVEWTKGMGLWPGSLDGDVEDGGERMVVRANGERLANLDYVHAKFEVQRDDILVCHQRGELDKTIAIMHIGRNVDSG